MENTEIYFFIPAIILTAIVAAVFYKTLSKK